MIENSLRFPNNAHYQLHIIIALTTDFLLLQYFFGIAYKYYLYLLK